MSQTLANHSYVDLSLVGSAGSGNGVQCITDLSTCCRITDGTHRGDWFFPSGCKNVDREGSVQSNHPGSRLSFTGDVHESRGAQGVDLYRKRNVASPFGLYRCDIPTNGVHDNNSSVRVMVYVGLYAGGCIRSCMYIPLNMIFPPNV